jgi:hypothetical protein
MMGRKKILEQPEPKHKESDEFFEGENYEQEQRELRDEENEARLREKRRWLRSLTQEDRDFIAKYGEELWKNWKQRNWKNGGEKERETS